MISPRAWLLLLSATGQFGQAVNTNLISTLAGAEVSFAGGVDGLSVPLSPGPWGKPVVDVAGYIYSSLSSATPWADRYGWPPTASMAVETFINPRTVALPEQRQLVLARR